MKKLVMAIAMFAFVASVAVAEDFSVTLPQAGRWPGKLVTKPGEFAFLAPPGTIHSVEFDSRGWVQGGNSLPMWVMAVRYGDVVVYHRIKKYCRNPATGEWFKQIAQKPTPISYSLDSPSPPERTETLITERFIPSSPPPMLGGREISPGYSLRYGTRSESVKYPEVVLAYVPSKVCPTDQTCGTGTAPKDPPVG